MRAIIKTLYAGYVIHCGIVILMTYNGHIDIDPSLNMDWWPSPAWENRQCLVHCTRRLVDYLPLPYPATSLPAITQSERRNFSRSRLDTYVATKSNAFQCTECVVLQYGVTESLYIERPSRHIGSCHLQILMNHDEPTSTLVLILHGLSPCYFWGGT